MNLNIFNSIEKLKRKHEEVHELLNELKKEMDNENNIGILEEFLRHSLPLQKENYQNYLDYEPHHQPNT